MAASDLNAPATVDVQLVINGKLVLLRVDM